MAAPILMPIILGAGFDPYWFAVVLTINMEIGLISPPVGLNLYVINGIAPEIPLKTILKGSLPYVACMGIAIIILCLFPGIATWLPDVLMGTAVSRQLPIELGKSSQAQMSPWKRRSRPSSGSGKNITTTDLLFTQVECG